MFGEVPRIEREDPLFIALFGYTNVLSVALGYRDLLTRLHSERVLGISEAIGVACGLSEAELGILRIAASLHDVGKIGIPDHILLKPHSLDQAERERIRQHSEIGQSIVAATKLQGAQQASLVIRHHHEHYNGLGYPDGLSGEAIPVCSRIISVADSYDAMAVTRAYQEPKSHSGIMDILHQETAEKHDPEVMRVFCQIIETSRFKAPGL